MNKTVLEIDDLSFGYPDTDSVLENLSLTLSKGEKCAVAGSNGSGKTTLFLLISGILKPDSGSILVNSKEVKHKRFNPDTGYLFQSPDDQLFSESVFQDVAFGPLNMGYDREEVKKAAVKALDMVGAPEISERMPHHLSGGEKRMAALASILSMDPKLLLLDEPTVNLDMSHRRRIINTMNSINKTMLIASHDLEFLLETCDTCILIKKPQKQGSASTEIIKGEILETFSNEEIMRENHLEKPHSLVPHRHIQEISGYPSKH